jgi:hypothetical protein
MAVMKRYKVRFHLAKGDNYMKWQLFDLQTGTKSYLDPDFKSIVMFDCELGNHASTAKKIYEGADKTVCGWVACDDVEVKDSSDVIAPVINGMTNYKYNPRKNPHWFTDTHLNRDGVKFKIMMTHNRKVYG